MSNMKLFYGIIQYEFNKFNGFDLKLLVYDIRNFYFKDNVVMFRKG